jgi:hypothetical protein
MDYKPPVISGVLFLIASECVDQANKTNDVVMKGAYLIAAGCLYIGTFIALQQGWILALKGRYK